MTYSELIEGAYLEMAKKAMREIEADRLGTKNGNG